MITYKFVALADRISNAETTYKYYPRICDRRKVKLNELSEQISKECSFTPADVIGVLEAFISVVPRLMLNNCSVELGELGIFSLHAKVSGSESSEQVSQRNIGEVKMAFRPSRRVKQSLTQAKFQKKKS